MCWMQLKKGMLDSTSRGKGCSHAKSASGGKGCSHAKSASGGKGWSHASSVLTREKIKRVGKSEHQSILVVFLHIPVTT